jgi:hypothetical protein
MNFLVFSSPDIGNGATEEYYAYRMKLFAPQLIGLIKGI